ncbi:DUF4214 domain-containing protein [Frisingicoccus sp.]|uniref:DUF4214 domain-containing protein n=1 Tax=Frisingicoccus sp. TaxID=1918627 RepID=UPI003AB66C97
MFHIQKKIDWEKVAASDVSFAIIRCGYGDDYESQDDAWWEYNANECTRLGIPFGVYMYSYALNTEQALSEAYHTLRLVKDYNLSFPIYLDLEDEVYTGRLSNKEIADIAEVYCNTIEAAGYDVTVYANLDWFQNRLTDPRFDRWDKWVADIYSGYCAYEKPYSMWQCTFTGTVDGINCPVDLNFTMDYEFIQNTKKQQVEGFVTRLYKNVLGREADSAGLEAWEQVLIHHQNTGSDVACGFIFSKEFAEKQTSNEEFVEIMYHTFLDRASDSEGKADWLESLDQGLSREYIIHGFVESKEFSDLCKQYGILRGSVNLSRIADQYPEITKFLVRNYRLCLGREADKKGLNEWCEAIRSGQNTAKEAAAGFVFSREFEKKELSDEDFIKTMYNVFMDREADEIGMQEWQQVLSDGKSREHVFNGFADSKEFKKICESYGIK